MNEDKKLISAIIVVVMSIFLISGGTFAYWVWTTTTLEDTLVNSTVSGDANEAKMYIDFPSEEMTGLYPTYDCDPLGTTSWVAEITVDNKTGVVVSPSFKLKVKIEDKNGNVITNSTSPGNDNPNRHYIKYAVTSENGSCSEPLITGNFSENTPTFENETDWYDSGLITKFDQSTSFPIVSGRINSGASFHAKANGITTHKFRVYAWLDKTYTGTTVGTTVTDPMQEAKVTVSWSENSELLQVKKAEKTGSAVAIYSADDSSLRFYRDENPDDIGIGSTYNGRTVTKKYIGFENMTYPVANAVPWMNDSYNTVVMEDYIYPMSTAYWFNYSSKDNTNINYDLTKLDTSNVTNMSSMFSGRTGTIVGMNTWDTSKVTNMSTMFYHFTGEITDIENWDTSNVTNMDGMFYAATNVIVPLDLRGWNVCNVTSYTSFKPVGSSSELITEPYFGSSKCRGVKGEAIAIYSADDNSLRFYRDENPDNIIEGESYKGKTVTKIYTGFETNTNDYMLGNYTPWYNDYSSIEIVSIEDYIYPLTTSFWFAYLSRATFINLDKIDTSNVTNMMSMFQYNTYLTSVEGLENWDVSNVTNMDSMFYGTGLTSVVELENWDTSNVTNMISMFAMSSLTSVEGLENWDVSNVTNMSYMFNNMNDVTGDLRNWQVCKISTRPYYFSSSSNILEPTWGMTC